MAYPMSIINTLGIIFSGAVVLKENLEQIPDGVSPEEESRIRRTNDEFYGMARLNHNRFKSTFNTNVFKDEYAILYEILYTFNINSFSEEQVRTLIDNNRSLILDSPYVDLSPYTKLSNGNIASDDEKIIYFRESLIELLKTFKCSYISESSFQSSCSIFLNWFKEEFMTETINQMALINSINGADIKLLGRRRATYKGYKDSQKYYSERMNILSSIEEDSRINHIVYNSDYVERIVEEENSGSISDNFVLDTGITEIDSAIHNLRRTELLGLLGPPKGGKTRFTAYLAVRALVQGKNVAVWALEGTKEEWEAYIISSFLRQTQSISIDASDIIQKTYMVLHKNATKEERERANKTGKLIQTARLDLSCGYKYGKLSLLDGVAYVEDFLDVLQSHYDVYNAYDVIVIDSLVNIQSRNNRGVKTENISKAYQMFKQFISKNFKRAPLAIVPAQLKQSAVDYLRKNPDETIDVTAGGESAETIRTPDEVIGIFTSKEERAAGVMNFYHVASRHGNTFDDFTGKAEYGCCYFSSLEE